MKPLATIFLALLVAASPIAHARDGGKGKGGGNRAPTRPSNSGNTVKRSPTTGSKIARPTPKPAPQPASRPSPSKPAARPAPRPENKPASRPSFERPTTRPAIPEKNNRPGNNNRPGDGNNAPGNNNRPGNENNRPGSGNNRPGDGGNRPGGNNNQPGSGNNRPGGNNNQPGNNNNRPGDGGNRPGGNNNQPGSGNNRPGGNNNFPGSGNNRPGNNNNRPGDSRPNLNRPNNNRPNTLPGMVTYPNRPQNNRPNIGGGNNNQVNINKVTNNRYNNVHINKVNVNRKNNGLNRPGNFPNNKHNWDNKKWGGNNGIWGNNNNININNNVKINNNFRNNYNYACRPNYWGSRPWWGAGSCHTWHHGHWNYGYSSRWYSNRYYYNNNSSFASGVMWGIGVWSLGNLIYDMGYQSYRNPYPAPPVQSESSKSTIVYNQPISVTAAANPPGDEEIAKISEAKSNEALERSRAAFKGGDYVLALKANEEAIGHTPGDSTLHEYRALCLFALGKYGDAAGVLNPVLASGPGWGWDTMVDFYQSSTVYDGQLRKLESYVQGRPDAADGHFLLGYHYLVCGHTEKAYEHFKTTAELQPADSIARQLRDLMKDSLPDDGASEVETPLPPPPVPSEKLVGTWVNTTPDGGKITFKMEESGDFVWNYTLGENTSELKGTYGLDDQGLLVLTTDDTQMVSSITLPQDSELKFVLVGSPTGDPGLDFKKS